MKTGQLNKVWVLLWFQNFNFCYHLAQKSIPLSTLTLMVGETVHSQWFHCVLTQYSENVERSGGEDDMMRLHSFWFLVLYPIFLGENRRWKSKWALYKRADYEQLKVICRAVFNSKSVWFIEESGFNYTCCKAFPTFLRWVSTYLKQQTLQTTNVNFSL